MKEIHDGKKRRKERENIKHEKKDSKARMKKKKQEKEKDRPEVIAERLRFRRSVCDSVRQR